MNRRRFVRGVAATAAAGAASGAAGCLGLPLGRSGPDSRYRLSLNRTPDDLASAAALTADEQTDTQRRLVAKAVDGTHRTRVHASIEDGDFAEFDGAYYRIRVSDATYTTEKVAGSKTAFEAFVRERFVTARFDRGTLPESQREILDAAAADAYTEHGKLSADFRTILERIGDGEFPHGTARRFVAYDGRFYDPEFVESMP